MFLQTQDKKPKKTKNDLSPQEVEHIHVSVLDLAGIFYLPPVETGLSGRTLACF